MTDVNAADVLVEHWGDPRSIDIVMALVDTLLAWGGDDPVVIMPDGTLRRLRWGGCCDNQECVRNDECYLADPVQP